MAGVMFCLAGLLFVLADNIPIGMMLVCVGLTISALHRRSSRRV